MRRYPLVIAGTVAGAAAVLAFPTHKATTALSSGAGPSTASSAAGSSSSGTSSTGSSGSSSSGTGAGSGSSGSGSSAAGSSGSAATSAPSATRTATGTRESFRFGDIAVKVTVAGTKVTNVGIASIDETDGRSQAIDQYAVPQLEQQAISAGSANIDGVSGATYTSEAFAQSLASALSKLGIA